MMMERITIRSLPAMLLAAAVIWSCSDNPALRMRYQAEKLYHGAERQLQDVQVRPERERVRSAEAVAPEYARVWAFCLTALDSLSSQAHPVEYHEIEYLAFKAANRLSQLYSSSGNFDTCVTILNRLLRQVSLNNSPLRTTMFNLGQALQASGAWDSALVVYGNVLDRFCPPVDNSGEVVYSLLNLPLNIFRIVTMTGDSAAAAQHYEQAERYYRDLCESYPQSAAAGASHGNLARLYERAGQWEKVISQLRALSDTTADNYLEIRLNVADVYATGLKNTDSALSIYNDLLTQIDVSDTLLRPRVLFNQSVVRMDLQQYNEAREILVDLKRNYPRYYSVTPMAQFLMAGSFEQQGNWSRAETEYKLLIEKYHGSDQAMTTYLHLIDSYQKQGRQEEARRWRHDAEDYFDRTAARRAGTMMEARALLHKAELYARDEQWQNAAEILTALADKFPNTTVAELGILRAVTIYRDKLSDPRRADSLIGRLKSSTGGASDGGET
ncbi:MAG: tetratricopeptide repeat protein [candidate division Zixibacteria bacterium]|nr:tetratricopeptide repeat protein [candidate division Zixibacteria bacterium]